MNPFPYEALNLSVPMVALFNSILNGAQSKAGLQIGTTSKKEVRVNNSTTYTINGVFLTKAAAEVGFTATTMDIPASASVAREAVYVISVNAGGTLKITMGEIASGAGNAIAPKTPTGEAFLGTVRIRVVAGATPFDATTNDLDAAHLVVTYTDAKINSRDITG